MQFILSFALFFLMALPAMAAETVVIPGSTANPGAADHMFLQTNTNQLAPAQVCYTSDGNGNIIPITGGGGGGGGGPNTINPAGTLQHSVTIAAAGATTFNAPAHAIGFLIEASSSNTANLRWEVGGTVTTTVGMRLEPGRDSGYIPIGAAITVIAETGSAQEVDIQWTLNQ